MDIFSWLRKDQTETADMLMAWIANPQGPAGEDAWTRWLERWEIQVRIEENFLFPRLKGDPGLRRRLDAAIRAHGRIREAIGTIRRVPPDESRSWVEKTAELLESVEAHTEMEEYRLFPRASDFLSRDDAEELASEVQDFLVGLNSSLAARRH